MNTPTKMMTNKRKTLSRILPAITCVFLIGVLAPQVSLAQNAPVMGDNSASVDRVADDTNPENCPEKPRKGKFVITLKPETELADLITWAMTFHCKNFVYSAKIARTKPKITILTLNKMTASQAWRVFLVSLRSMNYTVIPKGNILEIVEISAAKTEPLPLYLKGQPAANDQMVRVVLRPEHISVDDLATILNELKSKSGKVTAIAKAGIIMVTDSGTNISKMSRLMETVDEPMVGERLYMVRVNYGDAGEMATKLTEILGTKDSPKTSGGSSSKSKSRSKASNQPTRIGLSEVQAAVPSKMISDERTNSIIVLGSKAAYMRVAALVKRLDVALATEESGRIHVYELQHSKAEELSQTLSAVITGGQQSSSTGRRTTPRTPNRATPSGDSSAAFEGQVKITHDTPTNSLVVVASVRDFQAVKEVIRKLDIIRPQVYIEAHIVEINVSNSSQFGTSWHGGLPTDSPRDESLILGGLNTGAPVSSTSPASLAGASGLSGGILGAPLVVAEELLGVSIPSFGVLFNAVANSSNANVLSTPHILTTDNQEAIINVGQSIPYLSSRSGGLAGGVGGAGGAGALLGTQNIQRKDVGLNLKITPHINAGEMVRLEVDLEISKQAGDSADLGPTWGKRAIKDTIIVKDQQPVVLGGLMSEETKTTEQKVPLLGDIPVIGALLFKFKRDETVKTNLLIVLTPHIIQSQMDLDRLVEKRTREQQEFADTHSNFAKIKYRSETDYRKKRGVLEEINRKVLQLERDSQELQELNANIRVVPDGEIEYFEGGSDNKGGQ